MQKTKIPWATHTWNPIRGCSPVSEGCVNCYAARLASRFNGPGKPFEGLAKGGKWTGEIRFIENELFPRGFPKAPSRIFVCSMSDLFAGTVQMIADILGICRAYKQHTFCILTKRAGNIHKWFNGGWAEHWPLPNVWIGVTVENQKRADERIPLLLQTPAAKRFISVEPMLGPVELRGRWLGFGETEPAENRLDWIICGSESGPGRRPFDPDWARSLRDQCQEVDIPFFYKQGPDENGKIVDMPQLDGKRWAHVPGR